MENIDSLIDLITSGKCILFLGAGASYTSKLHNGDRIPLGNGLAEKVYGKFYPSEKYDGEDLQQVSSMVSASHGAAKLHDYLYDFLNNVQPSQGLLDLTKFKWANIYTTNIDQAIEIAYSAEEENAQTIITVVGPLDNASENSNVEATLYKLHGCIARKDVPLVFSLEEYATFKDDHLRLFDRLSVDLVEKSAIFIGYSLRDSNFQQVWSTIQKYCKSSSLPNKYYFVGPNIKGPLANYLSSKGFSFYDMGVDEFGKLLLQHSRGKRESMNQYMEKNLAPVSILGSSNLSVAEKYELTKDYVFPILEVKKAGTLSSKQFYHGAEPDWGVIKNNLDAPRDITIDIFEDFNNWKANPSFDFWLINGRAGDGKSTLLKRIAVEMANQLGETVLFAHSRSTLDPKRIIDLAKSTGKPLVVFIDNISDRSPKTNKLLSFIRKEKAKILLIGAARSSDWHIIYREFFVKPKEYVLDKLSDLEIREILQKLKIHDCLDYLEQLKEDDQITLFREKSDRELIVALKELTTNLNFDEIIADEFSKIKSEDAKRAYLHICLINQLRYRIPSSLLVRVMDLDFNSIREKVFQYTEGIIYFDDTRDGSDYLLRSRHSMIAKVVVTLFFTEDVKKFEFLRHLIASAIPSNPLEASLIKKLGHHSTIREIFSDPEVGVQCYNLLCEEFPDDSFLWQQRALFLANHTTHFEESQASIKTALKLNPHSYILKNTQGTILLNRALDEQDISKSMYLLEEGKRVLLESIRKSFGSNPYHYHSLINHLITWYKNFNQQNEKLLEEIQSLLEEASIKHSSDTMLITEQGRFNEILDKSSKAKGYFEKAIALNPRNMSARYLLSKLLCKEGLYDDALDICSEGIRLKPDEFFLNRLKFEILHKLNRPFDEIKSEYIKSISYFKDDSYLKLCCAAYLYLNGDSYSDKIFGDLRNSSFMSHKDKLRVVYDIQKFINVGDVSEIGYSVKSNPTGWYLKSERFDSKTLTFLSKYKFKDAYKIKDRSRVEYNVKFCYLGPIAFDGKIL